MPRGLPSTPIDGLVVEERIVKAARRINLTFDRRKAFVTALRRVRDANKHEKLESRHGRSGNAWLFDQVNPYLQVYDVDHDEEVPAQVVKMQLAAIQGDAERGRYPTAIAPYLAWLASFDRGEASAFLTNDGSTDSPRRSPIHAAAQRSLGGGRRHIQRDWEIASHRIIAEKNSRSGHLSVSKLDIDALPEKILDMDWLQYLACTSTLIEELPALGALKELRIFDCSYTNLLSLPSLKGCDKLQTIFCGVTALESLGPVADCNSLERLFCGRTMISDLSILTECPGLRELHCEETRVTSLEGLRGSSITLLDIQDTEISSLEPLANCQSIETLLMNGCDLEEPPHGFWHKPSLKRVILYRGTMKGIKTEKLSHSFDDDCLPRLRRHFA